jgi:hypothetical protein
MSMLASYGLWQENHAFVKSAEALDAIHQPHVNLAIWKRTEDPDIRLLADELAKSGIAFEATCPLDSLGDALTEALGAVATTRNGRRLIADIQRLAVIFTQHTQAVQLRVSLESVKEKMCPKFHADNVTLRLLCTYVGEGTQWLENSNVNHHADCCGGSLVRDVSRIRQLAPFEVALMKGKQWPGNTMGIYHRSPEASLHTPRLVVKMDVA